MPPRAGRESRADRTIFVAHDGSLCAQVTADLALQVAGACGLDVAGLFVVDECAVFDVYADYRRELGEPDWLGSRSEVPARYSAIGIQASATLTEQCHAAGVTVSTKVLLGGVPALVLGQSDGCAMLALGRRGRRHERNRRHLGRNFLAVARRTSLPILVGGDERRRIRRQLLAYDTRRRSAEACAWASRLQRGLSTEVIVMPVPGVDPAMEPRLRAAGLRDYQIVPSPGRPGPAIVSAAIDMGTDIVVMGGGYHHRRTLGWLRGSVFDEVLRGIALPVLLA